MQIAITGATGLIGKHLVDHYLKQNAVVHILSRQVQVIDNEKIRWFQADLADCSPDDLVDFVKGSDILFHCAAELGEDGLVTEVNVGGTKKLFAAAKGHLGRWVQLSSVGVYGQPQSGMIDEDYPADPQNPYEKSKFAADTWLTSAAEGPDTPAIVIIRPSTVYAGNMTNQSLFQLLALLHRGWFRYIGSRYAIMNYVHVDNVLQALLLAGHHPEAPGGTFIVSEYLTIREFIENAAQALDASKPPNLVIPEWIARLISSLGSVFPGFPLTSSRIDALTNHCVYSENAIRNKLGYTPVIPLREGLRRLVSEFLAS
ncbi:MAG: NAD-dependent epimerase/dehydratase family protein [Desulfobacteraceae bacterium]|nr:NAD-dependent epimerase/dehydratase family protein [Desulfobacteraceae bacterium]